ncbi:uncharacterized protein BCR38DRAFT_422616 [Pseudomassariella vexata]|uniref:Zn(2)-C6 fungal-type domain-containing protein n=1 Tax=Pseudomassariella vexata TaxID=1141098 RepID=A0A1Y2EA44_9PEZI|nr:uncharacterized protein BCR38DRAFT_422616 [Pseudomassariella vexata]ORY68267.1 hypothetical protein BCR38DRAFT_422616 [Pseudomassariella vexata]
MISNLVYKITNKGCCSVPSCQNFHIKIKISSTMKEGVNRHLACNRCRVRKVRCDGQKPYCKRCANGGAPWECSYQASVKQRPPRRISSDSNSYSPTMNESETPEARDAENLVVPLGFGLTPKDMETLILPQESNTLLPELDSEANAASFSSVYETQLTNKVPDNIITPPDEMQLLGYGMPVETGQISPGTSQAVGDVSELPHGTVEALFKTYFDSCQTICRLFDDRERLYGLMYGTSSEEIALQNAICAHAVPACSQISAWVISPLDSIRGGSTDWSASFYRLARKSLDECGHQGSVMPSLRFLQATILIGIYEQHHAEFGRSWLTASRAVWLMEALQLHKLESGRLMAIDVLDMEEARKALWAASSMMVFISLGSRIMDFVVPEVISASLLQPQGDASFSRLSFSTGEVFRRPYPRPLLVQEGICAADLLCCRIVSHIKRTNHASTAELQPYNFWINHHRLEEMLRHISTRTPEATSPTSPDTPDACAKVVLDILLKALLIVLHEAKLKKMRVSNQNQFDQIRASGNVALQRSLEIAEAVQTSVLPTDARANITLSWAVYVTLQSLLRQQRRDSASWPLDNVELDVNTWSNSNNSESVFHYSTDTNAFLRSGTAMPAVNLFEAAGSMSTSLTGALVLDSFNALQSTLEGWCSKSPIVAFFLGQIKTEMSETDEILDGRFVGLADFTSRNCWPV